MFCFSFLSDDLREHLKNAPKMIMSQPQEVGSSDSSDSSDSSSSESESDDSSSSEGNFIDLCQRKD